MMSEGDAGLLPLSATEPLATCVGRCLTSLVRYASAPTEEFTHQKDLPKPYKQR